MAADRTGIMIIRDARPADLAAVQRLIGQLADGPDAAEFRRWIPTIA